MSPRPRKVKEETAAAAEPVVKTEEIIEPAVSAAETSGTKKTDASPVTKKTDDTVKARKTRVSRKCSSKKDSADSSTLSIDSKDKKTAAAEKKKPTRRSKAQPVQEATPPVTVETVIEKLKNKINSEKAAEIDGRIAIDIKLYGTFEQHIYILVNNGQVSIEPYEYNDRDIETAISVEDALAIVDGTLSVKDALINGQLYACGRIDLAFKIVPIFLGGQ